MQRFPSALFVAAVLIASSTLTVARPGKPGSPSRLDDVYAIYSFLLEHPGPSQIRFALRGQPVTFFDEVGVFYLVSDDIAARDSDEEPLMDCNDLPLETREELVADLREHRGERFAIDWSRVSVSREYQTMTVAEEEAWLEAVSAGTFALEDRNENRVRVRVGYVYFNRDRTVAVAYGGVECGPLCGEGGHHVFTRGSDGNWDVRPNKMTCGWVS